MSNVEVPPSLEKWAELNSRADAALEREDEDELERLYPEIEEAWRAAPFQDRFSVDWEELKQVWHDRKKML